MIDLMIKSIFENSNKINSVVKHINKTNAKFSIQILLLSTSIYILAKSVKKNEIEISKIKMELEEMKSKGE